jgi:hypothetical protein
MTPGLKSAGSDLSDALLAVGSWRVTSIASSLFFRELAC